MINYLYYNKNKGYMARRQVSASSPGEPGDLVASSEGNIHEALLPSFLVPVHKEGELSPGDQLMIEGYEIQLFQVAAKENDKWRNLYLSEREELTARLFQDGTLKLENQSEENREVKLIAWIKVSDAPPTPPAPELDWKDHETIELKDISETEGGE